jgi:tRNA(fMet)-specific endonuclease VapC
MESLIFDTTFLIDFQRERKRGQDRAHRFLERKAEAYAYLPVMAYGEYAEGFESLSDPAFVSVVESYEIIEVSRPIADRYAALTRELRAHGQLIGANDLWIAATALHRDWPLVTRNLDHFARVDGILLMGY